MTNPRKEPSSVSTEKERTISYKSHSSFILTYIFTSSLSSLGTEQEGVDQDGEFPFREPKVDALYPYVLTNGPNGRPLLLLFSVDIYTNFL